MPMYEYVCEECQHPFEALVFDKNEVVECPKCHSTKLNKQFSVPAGVVTEGSSGSQSLPSACQSQGPPCGRQCSRWTG
jgi:putative FmdB family regulatory protein